MSAEAGLHLVLLPVRFELRCCAEASPEEILVIVGNMLIPLSEDLDDGQLVQIGRLRQDRGGRCARCARWKRQNSQPSCRNVQSSLPARTFNNVSVTPGELRDCVSK